MSQWEPIGEPIHSEIQICPEDHTASVMWRGDGKCPLCEAEALAFELESLLTTLRKGIGTDELDFSGVKKLLRVEETER